MEHHDEHCTIQDGMCICPIIGRVRRSERDRSIQAIIETAEDSRIVNVLWAVDAIQAVGKR